MRFGKRGSCSIGGPSTPRSSASSSAEVGDPDRALRVADRDVLEAAAVDLAGAVAVAVGVVGRAQRRAAHVDAAGGRAEDRRPDLARDRLDRELALVGPAGAAQVEDRLAGAVAGELGLRAVGVEDPQAGDEAGLVGRGELEHAVAARAGVPVAEPPDALGGERERERVALHDEVVVAERLPLLEPHGSGDHAQDVACRVVRVAAGEVDVARAGQLAQPGELALGVAARAQLHRRDVAAEQLLEAERLARGRRRAGGVRRGSTSSAAPAATMASTRASMRR